jgi:hypothetical protein
MYDENSNEQNFIKKQFDGALFLGPCSRILGQGSAPEPSVRMMFVTKNERKNHLLGCGFRPFADSFLTLHHLSGYG